MPLPHEIFKPDLDRTLYKNSNAPRNIRYDLSFSIYPFTQLEELIKVIREHNEHTIRFLVDGNLNIWFSREGSPGKHVAGHGQMTGKKTHEASCITAGDLTFSKDYKEIIGINHKSGDFRPSFDSLKWALAILVENQTPDRAFQLASELSVEELTSQGVQKSLYQLKKDDIISWCTHTFSEENLKKNLREQPLNINKVTYSTPKDSRPLQYTPQKRPARFFIDDSQADLPRTRLFKP